MGDYVDFKAVKAEVSIEDVARRYGVSLKRSNGSHERGKCPLPTHPMGEDVKSFSINTTKQVWICHSTGCAKSRRGKRGGDVIELVAVMENCSLRDAGLTLAAWYGVDTGTDTKAVETVARSDRQVSPQPVTDGVNGRYGIYNPLAEWIDLRVASEYLSPFEKSAYIAVLGQIEEITKGDRHD